MVPKGFGRTTSRALFPHLTMRKRTPDLVWGKERESKHKKTAMVPKGFEPLTSSM